MTVPQALIIAGVIIGWAIFLNLVGFYKWLWKKYKEKEATAK